MHAGQKSFVDDEPQNTVNLILVHIHTVSIRGMDASGSYWTPINAVRIKVSFFNTGTQAGLILIGFL